MRSFKFFRSFGNRSDGFILVAVLWLLGALAMLAAIYALYVRETTYVFVDQDERLETQGLALAGVELAAYQLTANPNARPTCGRFNFPLGKVEVTVDFRAENSRIDLNMAPRELLAGLFIAFGVQRDTAVGYADRIVAWRTPATAGTSGPTDGETSLYRSAGLNYGPRHAPFNHVNELGLVLGLPPDFVDRALPYLTVYSGQPEVNVLCAAPEVLAALPGLTPERLDILLSQRAGAPQDFLRAQLGMGAQYVTAQPSNTNRVTVDVRLDANRRVRSEAVILLLPDDTEPYRIQSWRDEDTEPLPGEPANASLR